MRYVGDLAVLFVHHLDVCAVKYLLPAQTISHDKNDVLGFMFVRGLCETRRSKACSCEQKENCAPVEKIHEGNLVSYSWIRLLERRLLRVCARNISDTLHLYRCSAPKLIFRNSTISGAASRTTEIQHGPCTALYTDAFRTLYPGEGGHFTFCDYFRQAFARNRGIRIDHFLLSPQLAKRAGVLRN
jgi:hypothetical protein